jgi:hypothetical protein
MKKDDPFDDLEKLRLKPAATKATIAGTTTALKTKKRNQNFTMVPHSWRDRLAEGATSAYTYQLALDLLYRDWKTDGRPIRLANEGLPNITRWGKYRALAELERLRLVAVDRRDKKSPIVKILRSA